MPAEGLRVSHMAFGDSGESPAALSPCELGPSALGGCSG